MESILKSESFISLGLGENWSFEEAISKLKKSATIVVYDDTVSLTFFVRKAINGLIKFALGRDSKSNLQERLKRLLNYSFFWMNDSNHKHHKTHITKETFEEVLSRHPNKTAIGLKVDIEGSEWEILESIASHQSRFEFILMEIHDFDGHESQLRRFLHEMEANFYLGHLHANNFASLGENGFPSVFEITLVKAIRVKLTGEFRKELPIPSVDAPNARNRQDYRITF